MNAGAKRQRAPQITPELAATSRRAIELHQQGRLAEAERLYRRILAAMPRHFDALHLLAVIKGQQDEFEAAAELFEEALRINPDSAAALSNFGNASLRPTNKSWNKPVGMKVNLSGARFTRLTNLDVSEWRR